MPENMSMRKVMFHRFSYEFSKNATKILKNSRNFWKIAFYHDITWLKETHEFSFWTGPEFVFWFRNFVTITIWFRVNFTTLHLIFFQRRQRRRHRHSIFFRRRQRRRRIHSIFFCRRQRRRHRHRKTEKSQTCLQTQTNRRHACLRNSASKTFVLRFVFPENKIFLRYMMKLDRKKMENDERDAEKRFPWKLLKNSILQGLKMCSR